MRKVVYGVAGQRWKNFQKDLQELILTLKVRRVCEVGGGANPAVSHDFIRDHAIDYSLLDISQEELQKAEPGYRTFCVDICVSSQLPKEEHFDFIFTKMLAEHVPSGRDLHQNIFDLLVPGGYAYHFFPTLFAFPFVVNRLIPERLSAWVLSRVAPRDKVKLGKFPAYYSWCVGPSVRQIRRLEEIGYEVLQYEGLFGAEGYYDNLPLLKRISALATRLLVTRPNPHLTAFAAVLVRKPIS